MASFQVPCPSCDNEVPIADAKLAGTKVECPKCKYRFKVEVPKGVAEAAAKAGKGKAKGKGAKAPAGDAEPAGKKKGAKAKPNRKVLAAAGLGVLAVGLLVVGAITFGGKGEKDTPTGQSAFKPAPGPTAQAKGSGPGEAAVPKKDGDAPKVAPPLPASESDPTNLLPGGTRAVARFDLERARRTPLYNAVVDGTILDLFRSSLGLEPEAVALYFHAAVDADRLPFGVIRLKEPRAEADLVAGMDVARESPASAAGKSYYAFASDPFFRALGKSLAPETLFGLSPAAVPEKPSPVRPMAVCAFDTQTVLIGDRQALKSFLESLLPTGYPPYKTELHAPGKGPAALPKDGKVGDGAGRVFSANPTYRTIDPRLKESLNRFDPDGKSSSVACVAARLDGTDRAIDPSRFPAGAREWAGTAASALANASAVSANVRAFTDRELRFQVQIEMAPNQEAREEARRLTKEELGPAFAKVVPALGPMIGHRVAYRYAGEGTEAPVAPAAPPTAVAPAAAPPDAGLPAGPSKLDLAVSDNTITLTGDFQIDLTAYRKQVGPLLVTFANEFRSRMLVLSGSAGRTALAPGVGKVTAKDGTRQFPAGTDDERTRLSRFNLPYPPATRVGFLRDLLPYLGKADIAATVDPKRSWFDPENLKGAETWVPEFLSPQFPAAAWRATSPHAPGRVLGGTNFVGVAGIGRDAARYSALNPGEAKRMGVTGYDWGSKAEEVTDGLSNTIYLIRVPPAAYSRPWAAGGGATLVGIDDRAENPMADFASPGADGKAGTFALMADGSTRWIAADVDRKVFLAMATRAGGETLGDLDKLAPKEAPPRATELRTTGAKPPKVEVKPAPALKE